MKKISIFFLFSKNFLLKTEGFNLFYASCRKINFILKKCRNRKLKRNIAPLKVNWLFLYQLTQEIGMYFHITLWQNHMKQKSDIFLRHVKISNWKKNYQNFLWHWKLQGIIYFMHLAGQLIFVKKMWWQEKNPKNIASLES